MKIFLIIILFMPLFCVSGTSEWPGKKPDCWDKSRNVHQKSEIVSWKDNVKTETIVFEQMEDIVLSPNNGYWFKLEIHKSNASLFIYSEQDKLTKITISKTIGVGKVYWINENLIFIRSWWGRIVATDMIFNVEKTTFIYSEDLTNGSIAFNQSKNSCKKLGGCECIQKEN